MRTEMQDVEFSVLRADDPQEAAAWLHLLEQSPSAEVFAHPEYLQLFATGSQRAMCAAAWWGSGRVLYPFLLRQIPPYGPGGEQVWFDLTTPYGYGGAFAWGMRDLAALAEQFWPRLDSWAADSSVVSAFVRRSLFSNDLLPGGGEVQTRQLNVVRDLAPSMDEIWMDFEPKVRKNVKRATQSAVAVRVDSGQGLDDFLDVYLQTMDRRAASDTYYFSRAFFESVVARLPGRFAFFHAVHEQRVVSTELVLVSRGTVYSFLGGTDSDYFALRPNDLLKFEIIKWAKQQGYARFVLGGGLGSEDGIYRYKKAFAPSGVTPFFVQTAVLDAAAVEHLVGMRKIGSPGWEPSEGFFPPYRS